jgi:rod shape determining protein RodA
MNFDWVLLCLTLVLTLFGVSAIYSATLEGGQTAYLKQLCWIGIGLIGLILVTSIDYRTVGKFSYLIYGLTIIALIAVAHFGKVVSGSQRWLSLGPLSIQPSELTKLVIIITLARYYNNKKRQPYRMYQLLIPGLLTAIPCLFIAKQPDLGTALVIISLFILLSFLAGIKLKSLLIMSVVALTLLPIGWHYLRDYQKERIFTLFNPNTDTLGAGYHSLQSRIAIGSGGLLGKGFMAGTQSRLNFLPEKYTDFIFAVLAEELGFVGAIILIILYLLLILRIIEIASKAPDKLGMLIVAGISCMLSINIIFNIGMVIGILPIVGLPLPLMSYGGSTMLTNLLGIGLVLNVRMRRFLL